MEEALVMTLVGGGKEAAGVRFYESKPESKRLPTDLNYVMGDCPTAISA